MSFLDLAKFTGTPLAGAKDIGRRLWSRAAGRARA
jgi:hypothetical protein